MKHGLEEGESEDMMSSGRQVSSTIIRDGKDYPYVLDTNEYAGVRPEVMKSKREYLYIVKHCLSEVYDRTTLLCMEV